MKLRDEEIGEIVDDFNRWYMTRWGDQDAFEIVFERLVRYSTGPAIPSNPPTAITRTGTKAP